MLAPGPLRSTSSASVSVRYGVSSPVRSSMLSIPAEGRRTRTTTGTRGASCSRRARASVMSASTRSPKVRTLPSTSSGTHEVELFLDRDRELGEVERIGGEIVDERQLGRQLLLGDAEVFRHQPPYPRLHDAPHTCCSLSTLRRRRLRSSTSRLLRQARTAKIHSRGDALRKDVATAPRPARSGSRIAPPEPCASLPPSVVVAPRHSATIGPPS